MLAAWKAGCEDKITGSSKVFGIVGESKPMASIDQTDNWKSKGPIKKINLYYSWNYGCLQGVKVHIWIQSQGCCHDWPPEEPVYSAFGACRL